MGDLIEQPTVMGMKVGWSQKMCDEFKELIFSGKNSNHLKDENRILRNLRDKQTKIINAQLDEIERLKSIDKAAREKQE